jgi:hypothetical protein
VRVEDGTPIQRGGKRIIRPGLDSNAAEPIAHVLVVNTF